MERGESVMPQQRTPEPEKPRDEPEIILPNRKLERSAEGASGVRIFVVGRNGGRTYFSNPGRLTVMIAAIVLGALSIITLVIVLGVFLIWIPVIAVLVVALVLSSLLRGYSRRLR
jgi:CHASE2 domain-containing sensor protein